LREYVKDLVDIYVQKVFVKKIWGKKSLILLSHRITHVFDEFLYFYHYSQCYGTILFSNFRVGKAFLYTAQILSTQISTAVF
ncbi:hypothetical protein ACJX0J_006311, partial [Zea mays]